MATLIQCVGFWRFGIRVALMPGLSFASISPIVAIAADPTIAINGAEEGVRAV